jgi:hypothetical protein
MNVSNVLSFSSIGIMPFHFNINNMLSKQHEVTHKDPEHSEKSKKSRADNTGVPDWWIYYNAWS